MSPAASGQLSVNPLSSLLSKTQKHSDRTWLVPMRMEVTYRTMSHGSLQLWLTKKKKSVEISILSSANHSRLSSTSCRLMSSFDDFLTSNFPRQGLPPLEKLPHATCGSLASECTFQVFLPVPARHGQQDFVFAINALFVFFQP